MAENGQGGAVGRVISALLPGLLRQLITDPGGRRAVLGEAALHLAETSRARLLFCFCFFLSFFFFLIFVLVC